MKKLKLKKIIYTLAGGILGIALFVSLSGVVGAGPFSGIFDASGGTIGIDQFQMSRENFDRDEGGIEDIDSVLNSSNEGSIFRLVGSSMFSNILSFGQTRFDRLAVGFPSQFSFTNGDTALQVDGSITIKSLAHDGSSQVKACVNDFGVISACNIDYSCLSVPAHSTICSGDDTGLSEDTTSTLITDAGSCGAPKCEYSCAAGYTYNACFISNTLIAMEDGTTKNIQDVNVGDVLKGQTTNNEVLAFHRPMLDGKLYSFNGGEYFVTEEHPFMTTDGWKAVNPEKTAEIHNLDLEVGTLEVGDIILTEEGEMTLTTIDGKEVNEETQLYNFILDGDHTYYADGYLVHNKTPNSEFCKENVVVNGLCDETVNNGCTTGTLNDTADGGGNYLWECVGSGGGTTDSCSMPIPSCTTPTLTSLVSPDQINWNLNGESPSAVTIKWSADNSSWSNTTGSPTSPGTKTLANNYYYKVQSNCSGGIDSSDSNTLQYTALVNGACGSANGNTYSTPPTSHLCSAGTASSVTTNPTTYDWTCAGSGGGSTATCQANRNVVINGLCNALHYNCDAGSSTNNVADPEAYTWDCVGSGGGTTDSCSEAKPLCFVAGTKVIMADGSTRNIQDVKIGESVLGNNGEISIVHNIHMPILGERKDRRLYSFNGGPYFVTAEHPFKTTDGWKAMDPVWSMEEHNMNHVSALNIGDTLITETGTVILESIDYTIADPTTQLYNLMLGGNHTYYADGYLVHNKKEKL